MRGNPHHLAIHQLCAPPISAAFNTDCVNNRESTEGSIDVRHAPSTSSLNQSHTDRASLTRQPLRTKTIRNPILHKPSRLVVAGFLKRAPKIRHHVVAMIDTSDRRQLLSKLRVKLQRQQLESASKPRIVRTRIRCQHPRRIPASPRSNAFALNNHHIRNPFARVK